MDKLRRVLSGDDRASPDEETGIIGQVSERFNLKAKSKVYSFIIVFLIGMGCSLFGFLCLSFGLGLTAFAIFYTLGSIISLGSTCFFVGPINQFKKMFAPSRVIATVLVIVMYCLTMFAAFVIKKSPLIDLFMVLHLLAVSWYALSYIPFGIGAAKRAVSSCIV